MRYYEEFRIDDFQDTFMGNITIREALSLIFDKTANLLGNTLTERLKTVQSYLNHYDSIIIGELTEYFDSKRNIEGYEFRIGPYCYLNEYSLYFEENQYRIWRVINGVVLHSA